MKIILLALCGLMFPFVSAAQGPGLELTVPESITSQTEKPVELTLTVAPGELPGQAEDVLVEASAGKILEIQATQAGVYQVKFRPPWVASRMEVKISASARLPKLTLKTHKTLWVDPQAVEIGESRSEGALDMLAPTRLILGQHDSARISFKKPKGKSPVVLVSSGAISPLEEVSRGRLGATYTPPEQHFPQVAVIAVQGEDPAEFDWIAIPLHAIARVDAKTERGASVDILIGETIFGPLKADRRGRASMDVLVPPGVPTGATMATDSLGNTKKASLNLRVPAFKRILGMCPTETDRMRIIAVDAGGKPLLQANPMMQASVGQLSEPVMIGPGVYESVHSLPEGVPIGKKVELSAALKGDKASRVTCSVSVQGRMPVSMRLTIDPPEHQVGGPPAAVTIELIDKKGKPARMVSVELGATLGKLSDVRTASPGKYSASWTLPTHLKGKRNATITAATRGRPSVSAQAVVKLKAGPVTRLELSSEDTRLAADGHSTTTITARALDSYGNPVTPVQLVARAKGKISKLDDQSLPGTYQATYTAPHMPTPEPDTIVVFEQDTKIEASLNIALQKSRKALAVGPRIGYSTNLGRISSVFFAADAEIRLPFYPAVSVGIELGYYWSDSRSLAAGGEEEVSTSVWVVPILARAVFSLPVDPLTLYAGAGTGTAIVGREVSSPSTDRTKTSKAHFGLSGILGGDMKLGPGRVVAELGYLYVVSSDKIVQGNTGGLLITVGYRFEF